MRFSIFEYSQEKLLSLGLDVTDALLLNWFANFFCGKMEKQMFKGADGKPKIYGWIKISKVIEDLPVIRIASEKGIRNRFDAFVEKGILDRKTLATQNGKKSYYRTTAIYDSLINTMAIQKNQENNAKKDGAKGIPQRNENALANFENTRNAPQGNANSFAEEKRIALAQRNSSSFALNNSLIRDSLIKDIAVACEKHFGKNAFDSEFPNKAAAFLFSQKISDADFYFGFIKNKVSEKTSSFRNAVSSPRGLAYKLFFQSDVAQEAKDKQQQQLLERQKQAEKEKAEEARKVTCPVCKTRFLPDFRTSCPSCEFSVSYFQNETEIQIHSKFIGLSEKARQNYESRLRQICKFNLAKSMAMSEDEKRTAELKRKADKNALDKEFGLIT